jgi:hypothetical protein
MRAAVRGTVLTGLGLCLLSGSFMRLAWAPPAPATFNMPDPLISAADRSPAAGALRTAQRFRMRAQRAVNLEREALEAAAPAMTDAVDQEAWRQQLIARDPDGNLRAARAAAQRSAELARTPREAYRASLLLARINGDLGDRPEELRHARTLVRLSPKNPLSLMYLRQAAEHNRLRPLARWASARLHTLVEPPDSREPTW